MARVRPACPRHPHSTVWLDGKYGKKPHERQRYKCLPANGDPRHVFTETLPRLHGGTGECLECERHYESHEGPPTGRRFDYSTRDIAFGLMEVGKGAPDRLAGRRVRERANRLLVGKTPGGRRRRNKDGNTVADWVELFAPPIFESLRARQWPRVVALDAQPMRVKSKKKTGGQGGHVVFNILGAYGWDGRSYLGKVLAFEAAPNFGFNQGKPYWVAFLEKLRASLDGMPVSFICDQDKNILAAIEQVFPSSDPDAPVVFQCHWHLGRNLEEKLVADGVADGDLLLEMLAHRETGGACDCAFCDLESWHAFEHTARARNKLQRTKNWLNANSPQVIWQLGNRRLLTAGRTSIGPLEQVLSQVEEDFRRRRGMIHNRERLNRRLMLMQLELNEQASLSHYSKVIRDELLDNGGYGGPRYVVDDKAGSSLRIY